MAPAEPTTAGTFSESATAVARIDEASERIDSIADHVSPHIVTTAARDREYWEGERSAYAA